MRCPLVGGSPDLAGSGSSNIVIEADRFPRFPGSEQRFGRWCKNFRVLAVVVARMALIVAIGSESLPFVRKILATAGSRSFESNSLKVDAICLSVDCAANCGLYVAGGHSGGKKCPVGRKSALDSECFRLLQCSNIALVISGPSAHVPVAAVTELRSDQGESRAPAGVRRRNHPRHRRRAGSVLPLPVDARP